MTTASLAAGGRAPAEKRKIPLAMQITHARRELGVMRGYDLEGLVRPTLRPQDAKILFERAQAVLATLEWLRDNEPDIRAWVEAGRPKVEQP